LFGRNKVHSTFSLGSRRCRASSTKRSTGFRSSFGGFFARFRGACSVPITAPLSAATDLRTFSSVCSHPILRCTRISGYPVQHNACGWRTQLIPGRMHGRQRRTCRLDEVEIVKIDDRHLLRASQSHFMTSVSLFARVDYSRTTPGWAADYSNCERFQIAEALRLIREFRSHQYAGVSSHYALQASNLARAAPHYAPIRY
jgi:hypothetical protein